MFAVARTPPENKINLINLLGRRISFPYIVHFLFLSLFLFLGAVSSKAERRSLFAESLTGKNPCRHCSWCCGEITSIFSDFITCKDREFRGLSFLFFFLTAGGLFVAQREKNLTQQMLGPVTGCTEARSPPPPFSIKKKKTKKNAVNGRSAKNALTKPVRQDTRCSCKSIFAAPSRVLKRRSLSFQVGIRCSAARAVIERQIPFCVSFSRINENP